MAKSDKKLIRKFQKKYKWAPNTSYNAGFYFGEEYEGTHFITDKDGKIISIVDEQTGVEHNQNIVKQKEQKQIDKDFKKYIKGEKLEAKKKEYKTKKKLQEVKKDPTLAKEALEKAYKNYDEIVTKIEDAEYNEEDAKVRVLNRKKANATENLYKTSRAVQTLTGEGEMTDAYSYVTGDIAYKTKKDPMRGQDVLKSLDEPSTTLGVLKRPTDLDLKKLSDEELIKTLKLNQK
mgnify:CR=1 FL=1